jgi:hypothetical protein
MVQVKGLLDACDGLFLIAINSTMGWNVLDSSHPRQWTTSLTRFSTISSSILFIFSFSMWINSTCSVPALSLSIPTRHTMFLPSRLSTSLKFASRIGSDRVGSDLRLFNFNGQPPISAFAAFVYSKSKTSLLGSTDHKRASDKRAVGHSLLGLQKQRSLIHT